MEAIAFVPNNSANEHRPLMYVRGKNKQYANTPRPEDNPRQIALKLLENGVITHRDLKILFALLGVGILTRHQLQRLFWPEAARIEAVGKRLRLLAHYHVLEATGRYTSHLRLMNLEPCYAYNMGGTGLHILALHHALRSTRDVPYNSSYYALTQSNRLFTHHVQASELYTRLKVVSKQQGLELTWYNEAVTSIRNSEGLELVRPDGGFLLAGERPFLVEIDTRNTDWYKKVHSYEQAHRNGRWRDRFHTVTFPPVLCVVPNTHSISRIGEIIQAQQGAFSGVVYFLKAWSEVLVTAAHENWYHVHHEKPNINILELNH